MKIIDQMVEIIRGNTDNLNPIIKIRSHHLNQRIVDSFNSGYEEGIKEAQELFSRCHVNMYEAVNYEIDTKIEPQLMPAAQVVTGKGINIFTRKVQYIKSDLKEFRVSFSCKPLGEMISWRLEEVK